MAFFVILILGLIFYIYSRYWPNVTVSVGENDYHLLLADTRTHQIRGLSGRQDLGKWDGMLFVFADSGRHTMVMREMNFPLDIIWLKADTYQCDRGFSLRAFFFPPIFPCSATVVDIAPEVTPEPGRPESLLTPYFSRVDATLVWEAAAGFMGKTGLKIGDQVSLNR